MCTNYVHGGQYLSEDVKLQKIQSLYRGLNDRKKKETTFQKEFVFLYSYSIIHIYLYLHYVHRGFLRTDLPLFCQLCSRDMVYRQGWRQLLMI